MPPSPSPLTHMECQRPAFFSPVREVKVGSPWLFNHHDLFTRASGYVGGAFQRELTRRGLPFRAISRAGLDYSRFRVLADAMNLHRPSW